ncbi:MAG: winged helix DNA-binding domain-containing protein [Leifsonia sp.]
MDRAEAVAIRMNRLGLWHQQAGTPEAVVDGLLAMQAQEFPYALWSVAQRIDRSVRPTAAEMGVSYDLGAILRTHVLRPTWHFVTPSDARWLLTLTAPRVAQISRIYFQRAGLDTATLVRVTDAFSAAVADGRHRTRAELRAALENVGIVLDNLGFTYAVMFAELERVLISGVMLGRQRSYADFDERVPPTFVAGSATFDRENALAEIAARYFATRGPASIADMGAWSGLTLADCRRGLEVAIERDPGSLERVEVEGTECWMPPSDARVLLAPDQPRIDLLHAYDEYIMSYSRTRGVMQHPDFTAPGTPDTLLHAVLLDGTVAGTWKHTITRAAATLEVRPLITLGTAEQAALDRAAQDYGDYLRLPTSIA